jgi:hypothetical protein
VRACGGKIPSVGASVDEAIGESASAGQTWVEKTCLKRDKYRCAITGCFDVESVDQLREISNDYNEEYTARICTCYIIPFGLGKFVNNARVSLLFFPLSIIPAIIHNLKYRAKNLQKTGQPSVPCSQILTWPSNPID